MQVSKQPIYQFLEGSGKSFVVPVRLVVGSKDIVGGQVSVRTHEGESKVRVDELKNYLENLN